ncbi:MAG: ATP cone domain-containing protein [Candidatus Nanohaloarchaea archaeon]|nr:ATP cone domain-containing protein [Candidatus Nanohaloarchaea archaeon]
MRKVVTKDGDKEEFDERKLYASIYYPAKEAEYTDSGAEKLADEVVDAVTTWMDDHEDDIVTTKELRQHVRDLLEERDEGVAFLYATYLDIN